MTNILFVEHLAGIGGGQVCLLELLKHLDHDRFNPVVACVSTGELYDRLIEAGARVEIVDTRGIGHKHPSDTIDNFRDFARLIRRHDIKLIHVNSQKALLMSAPAALVSKVPIVWHCHVDSDFGWAFDLASAAAARAIVVNSEYVRRRFRFVPAVASKITLIYNGIDISRMKSRGEGRVRAELGIESTSLVVGTLGRLQAEKGMEYFLGAAPEIARELPDTKFLVVGGTFDPADPYQARLKAIARDSSVASRIIFTGFRSDIADCLEAMDIVVVPSLREGLPLAVAEAMAMKRPIVATAVGGIPEMIESGRSGVLVPAKSSEAIAKAVTEIARDRALAKRMGEEARRTAEAKFDIEVHAARMQELYSEVLAARGGRRRRQP